WDWPNGRAGADFNRRKEACRNGRNALDATPDFPMSKSMQMDRLTIKAQEALQAAQAIAGRFSHQELDGEHLALALLEQPEGLIQPLLQKLGATPATLKASLESELSRRAKVQGTTSSDVFMSQNLKKALDAAQAE